MGGFISLLNLIINSLNVIDVVYYECIVSNKRGILRSFINVIVIVNCEYI